MCASNPLATAEQQLGPDWTLMRDGQKDGESYDYDDDDDDHSSTSPPFPPSTTATHPLVFFITVPTLTKYLEEQLQEKSVVGIDPKVHSAKFVGALRKALSKKSIILRPLGQ